MNDSNPQRRIQATLERRRSNAAGTMADRRTARARTRSAQRSRAIAEQTPAGISVR